ncbi:unnamed protein product [Brassica rapa]|uniref:Uncharacterized protein n=1 Tax=Brassica campestris TaxID=3711 RepID=A0A3P5XXI1_BRACM|nr:unnamed protein product [Brassica rapa]VDC59466.1 unnamed protein product [Brassica rapa]
MASEEMKSKEYMSQKMPREVLTLNQIMNSPDYEGTTIISGESSGFDTRPYSGPTLRAKKSGCGNGYSSENYPRY